MLLIYYYYNFLLLLIVIYYHLKEVMPTHDTVQMGNGAQFNQIESGQQALEVCRILPKKNV